MNKDQRILASSVIKFLQDSCPKEQKDEIMKAVDIIEKVYDCKTLEKEGQVPLEKLYGVYKQTVNPTAKQTGTSAANLKVAEGLKAEGNKLLAAKDFKGAVEKYTAAIEADANNAVYYANRAAAYSQLQQHESAVYDAKKALQVNPNYSKAYSRLGHAEFCLGNYENAVDAYTLGLEKEPNNASIKQSLAAAQQKAAEAGSVSNKAAPIDMGGMPGLAGMPAGMPPNLANMMKDPNIMRMAQNMMSNPNMASMMQNMMKSGGNGAMPDISTLMSDPGVAAMASEMMKDPSALQGLMDNPEVAEMAKQYMKK